MNDSNMVLQFYLVISRVLHSNSGICMSQIPLPKQSSHYFDIKWILAIYINKRFMNDECGVEVLISFDYLLDICVKMVFYVMTWCYQQAMSAVPF